MREDRDMIGIDWNPAEISVRSVDALARQIPASLALSVSECMAMQLPRRT